ncbi:MAG: hypothetical protein PHG81_12650 [Aliarcobacter sp.]|nr:hypothetical protein [Aliarcobacter sp.]
MSRPQNPFPIFSSYRRNEYNWEKIMNPKTLARNKWLGKTWTDLYFQNQGDDYLRFLSTDDIISTKWFEKYGVKEPQF